MFRDYLLRLAFIVLTLFSSVSNAVVDSVPPTSGGNRWTNASGQFNSPSPQLACDGQLANNQYFNPLQGWLFSALNVSTGNNYSCVLFRTSNSSYSTYSIVFSGYTEPICPTPSNPPIPVYIYDGMMCTRTIPDAPLCPVLDTLHSKGFFNIGTVPTGQLLKTACVASCGLYLRNGYSPAGRSMVNGVWRYFGSAEYLHTGQTCTPDTPNFLSDFVGNLPSGTCAPGQSYITMNGVTKCIDSGGNDVNAASDAAAAKTLLEQRAAAAASAAREAATLAGADASGVIAAGVQAAADVAAAGVDAVNSNDPALAAYCQDNPDAQICASNDFGTVEDQALGEKTINVQITPFAVGGAGSCPAPTAYTLHGKTVYFEWATYCSYATGVKPLLLAFAWLAAAGILVGGFRTA